MLLRGGWWFGKKTKYRAEGWRQAGVVSLTTLGLLSAPADKPSHPTEGTTLSELFAMQTTAVEE